ncbi:hypothetical protein Bca4012_088724 [Brassica carinata]
MMTSCLFNVARRETKRDLELNSWFVLSTITIRFQDDLSRSVYAAPSRQCSRLCPEKKANSSHLSRRNLCAQTNKTTRRADSTVSSTHGSQQYREDMSTVVI